MSKTVYDAAFRVLKTQSEICSKFESIGLRFEYGDGFFGKSLESLINDSETIILESLGLHLVTKNTNTVFCGAFGSMPVDVLYSMDNDPDWAITNDDFCEFFYKAIDDEHLRNLMWRVMVDRDSDAKDEYNKLRIGKIGGYDFMYDEREC
jgi:hypothetical protein